MIVSGTVVAPYREEITECAVKCRLPARSYYRAFLEAYALDVNSRDLSRCTATYIDKILEGAKPADLPVEPPMKFEFLNNLKTAKQIGQPSPDLLGGRFESMKHKGDSTASGP